MASAEQANTQGFQVPSFVESFNKLDPRQRMAGMIGVALLITLIVVGFIWAREPSYAVLFANLDEHDGGQIVTTLQAQNIPYKISENGKAILVPGNIVHDTRLKLASQGLPKGGLVGFELMENQKMGASQFTEQINYQRGLEGELARSIQSIAAVKGARVHLAMPKQSAFLRDEQKPSASALVSLYPGRVLEPSQIAGIVHLISSSVPQLNPANVSIIDQDGNLISQQKNPLQEAGLDPSQLKYVRDIEASYIKRIEQILGTVVGASNVRAQVAADVDFSQSEQVAETYRPNPTPETAIRSQQTAETGSTAPGAVGVPGALTNQPPVPATAPLTTPPVAGQPATGANAATQPQPFTKNATINYEVDKTVKHTKGVPGEIRRLSVAVVVNNKSDGKGKGVPLTSTELKQVTDLAREAMGFNQDRGDTLNVANANFSPAEKEAIPDTPIWKDPETVSIGKELIKYAILALIAFLIWSKLIKPMLDRLAVVNRQQRDSRRAEGRIMEEEEEEMMINQAQVSFEKKLANAKEVAKQDPKLVASVIKEWVGGNEPR
ncbi:MAG TPA: flagellar basal-body MS-ring/collar protein FliF [Rhodocyclaceae bacterium]|nr:flagellar basal-body MS-ring/collar protein FliF [Rhodocyclaceae bacterium]